MNTNPEYKKINLRKEYPGFVGNTDFAVISDLCEEELISKFPELKCLQPFIIITVSQWSEISKAFGDFNRNNDKHQKRKTRKEDLFGYVDGETELHISNLETSTVSDHIEILEVIECLRNAMEHLTEVQKHRLKLYYLNDLTQRKIAELEGCNRAAVQQSIESAIEKLKKYL